MQSNKADMTRFDEIILSLDNDIPPYGSLTMTWKEAKMWDEHQTNHGPKSRHPDTCGICSDILKDEAEDEKKRKNKT
jgi:hypothetical protein